MFLSDFTFPDCKYEKGSIYGGLEAGRGKKSSNTLSLLFKFPLPFSGGFSCRHFYSELINFSRERHFPIILQSKEDISCSFRKECLGHLAGFFGRARDS